MSGQDSWLHHDNNTVGRGKNVEQLSERSTELDYGNIVRTNTLRTVKNSITS